MAQIRPTCVPKVPPFEPRGAARRPLRRHLDVHWDLLISENIKDTQEHHYFQDAPKLVFWAFMAVFVAVRGRKSDTLCTQGGHQAPPSLLY